MSIRIDGIDKAVNDLERIKKSLTFDDLDFWCKRITNEIKLIAQNESGEKFQLSVSIGDGDNPNINLSYMPDIADLVIETIAKYLIEMPILTQAIFEGIAKTVKQKKEEGNQ